jgi:hypothetical protein
VEIIMNMEAAVLAGRFASRRAYGYNRGVKLDAQRGMIRGILEIDENTAQIVRRIFAWFAAGLSSIQIATRLNEEGVPGPRGGQWNASTIRGDPKKLVGIPNNPLYEGRLVWAVGNGARIWTAISANDAIGYVIRRNGSKSEFPICASWARPIGSPRVRR